MYEVRQEVKWIEKSDVFAVQVAGRSSQQKANRSSVPTAEAKRSF